MLCFVYFCLKFKEKQSTFVEFVYFYELIPPVYLNTHCKNKLKDSNLCRWNLNLEYIFQNCRYGIKSRSVDTAETFGDSSGTTGILGHILNCYTFLRDKNETC